ncbi:DoxX family membrane protein [Empedobacter sp. UBA5987]|uniref:DoxX family membrane protein n=1 Tax=Empedobacter sp. UBA5987 TaxID=1946444 RepID=UPI0025C7288E|nr:DoxX family membrane protein [Empedobacter sp. UBA5987]
MNKFLNSKWFDFFIICARFLLAITFFNYGWSKLLDGQFGLRPEELNTPIKDLSLFRISWHLFEHQPFKFTIGIMQLITAILLLFNRTVILGTLLFLILISNILLIDETVMPLTLKLAFRSRLIIYIILCFLILYHNRSRFLPAIKHLFSKYDNQYKHKFWIYFLVPIGAIFIELFYLLMKTLYLLITDYNNTIESFTLMIKSLNKLF